LSKREVARADDSFVGGLQSRGTKSFWFWNLEAANSDGIYSDIRESASNTLNAAVQESLFGMMDELVELLDAQPRPKPDS